MHKLYRMNLIAKSRCPEVLAVYGNIIYSYTGVSGRLYAEFLILANRAIDRPFRNSAYRSVYCEED